MSRGNAIHEGDVGTTFTVTVYEDTTPPAALDLSTATTLQFKLLRPDDTVLTVTPTFVTDGTDGQLQYNTQAGDLDQAGSWELQVRYVLANGSDRHTTAIGFNVREVIA